MKKNHHLPAILFLASLLPLTAVLAATPAPAPAANELLDNSDMSEGSASPVAWDQRWVDERSTISVSRDTTEFHSAPASLKVSSVKGPAKAQVYQSVPVFEGDVVMASGWTKALAKAQGFSSQIAVQFTNANYQPLGFHQLFYNSGTSDWQTGSNTFVAPKDSASVALLILIEGEGSAWLDDASIRINPKVAVPSAAAASAVTPPEPDSGMVILHDFKAQRFDYGYGGWSDLGTIQTVTANGTRINGTASGGAGVMLKPALVLNQANAVRLRVIFNSGNNAPRIVIKLLGENNASAALKVRTAGAQPGAAESFLLPIPPGTKLGSIGQVQLQGDFSPGSIVDLDLIDLAVLHLD